MTNEQAPGRRNHAEWSAFGPEWKRARTLRKPDVEALTRTGRTAAMWARRNGKRAEWRIRDGGRVLWLRYVEPDAPREGDFIPGEGIYRVDPPE